MLLCLAFSLYVFMRRSSIRTQYKAVVVIFPLIVLLSGLFQVFLHGVAYEYAGSVFACLLLYVDVQAHNMDYDYLTGVLNRRGIDETFAYECEHYSKLRPFAAFLIDLDYFKEINDLYGHKTGDEALVVMAGFLHETFGGESYIGRYGGDEFLILSHVRNDRDAEAKIAALSGRCDRFNEQKEHPYSLSFSSGYELYDPSVYVNTSDFFRHIDALMYENKEKHHSRRGIQTAADKL